LVSLKEVSQIENFKNQMFLAIEKAKAEKKQKNNDSQNLDNPGKPNNFPISPNDDENYKNLTLEQLATEIQATKTEIEKLKKNTDLNEAKRQSQLQNRLKKLEKIKSDKDQNLSPAKDNKFPTG
jgi:DNA repair exonuclease SbcCD ATPase subunit